MDVIVEGAGAKAIVMIHGWPDSHRLWDGQVEALKGQYRCIRFTLPGFEPSSPKRAYPFAQLMEMLEQVVAPEKKVTLLLHDWGCLLGYQFALRHPERVERVIGVDIGDVAYQLWLALAWVLGADWMARSMARAIGAPAAPGSVRAQMGYLYAMRWLGVAGGLRGLRLFKRHWIMAQRPDDFNAAVLAWLAETEQRGTGAPADSGNRPQIRLTSQ